MKTKLNLLLTAVMLMLGVNVFAQSGSTNPVKGDVNGDGVVSVADIVAVIDIIMNGGGTATDCYFYLGTTVPTADNYKTLPGAVTTFTAIDEAVGTEADVAAGQTLYMMCPTAWMEGKSVAVETQSGETIDFLEDVDDATVPGYLIYKTQVWDAPSTVTLRTNVYYYFGFVSDLETLSPKQIDIEYKYRNNSTVIIGIESATILSYETLAKSTTIPFNINSKITIDGIGWGGRVSFVVPKKYYKPDDQLFIDDNNNEYSIYSYNWQSTPKNNPWYTEIDIDDVPHYVVYWGKELTDDASLIIK